MADNLSAVADIDTQISSFLNDARHTAGDGLTWAEFGQLLVSLLHLVVNVLDKVNTLSGQEKKEIALTAVAALFDTTASRCVPLVVFPAWTFLRPVLRAFVLALASGAVESMLHIVRAS
jgi:hypothetical protein